MTNNIQEYQRIMNLLLQEQQNLNECVENIGKTLPSGHEQKANPNHFLAILTRIIDDVRELYCHTKYPKVLDVHNELINIRDEDIRIEDIKRCSTEDAYDKMRNLYKCVEYTLKPILQL